LNLSRKALREKQAAAFRKSASALLPQIKAKRNPAISHQNLTARRARIAASMSADADLLEKLQQALEGLALDLEKNQAPAILRGVTTRGMVEALLQERWPRPGVHKSHVREVLRICKTSRDSVVLEARKSVKRLMASDQHDCFLELKSLNQLDNMLVLGRGVLGSVYGGVPLPGLTQDRRFFTAGIKTAERWASAHEAIMVYIDGPSPEQEREKRLKEMEHSLIGVKIPGFFPTPRKVAERLVEIAAIRFGMSVLEPSAGKGDIAEAIKRAHPKVSLVTIEVSHMLSKILEAKGFKARNEDFLSHTGFHDRIIMNPPFEHGQDIDHVRWAYSRLKPKGRLVSIMCEGPFFRNDKKSVNFREWFEEMNGTCEPLGNGAFQGAESFNQAGVNSRIVILEK